MLTTHDLCTKFVVPCEPLCSIFLFSNIYPIDTFCRKFFVRMKVICVYFIPQERDMSHFMKYEQKLFLKAFFQGLQTKTLWFLKKISFFDTPVGKFFVKNLDFYLMMYKSNWLTLQRHVFIPQLKQKKFNFCPKSIYQKKNKGRPMSKIFRQ